MKLLQENGRGKSDLPMIMGIIGFISTIPGTLCAGCAARMASIGEYVATGHSSGLAQIWVVINLASAATGLYFGIKSKSSPRTSGAVMIGIALLTLLLSFVTFNWFWGLIAVACFSIGGAVSLTQEKVGGGPKSQNLRAPETESIFTSSVIEHEKETPIVPPPIIESVSPPLEVFSPPSVIEAPSLNTPVQKFEHLVTQGHQATSYTGQKSQTNNNRLNTIPPNFWIWGLIAATVVLTVAVVIFEFMPSKKVAPEKTAKSQSELQYKTPIAAQTQIPNTNTASNPVTESEVSIGYVKTKTGSTLRMRKEPSETAEILLNVPDGSPVIILGYDNQTSVVNGESGMWCKIKFNDKAGWAWGSFIIRK